jgi:hypothetical protein
MQPTTRLLFPSSAEAVLIDAATPRHWSSAAMHYVSIGTFLISRGTSPLSRIEIEKTNCWF